MDVVNFIGLSRNVRDVLLDLRDNGPRLEPARAVMGPTLFAEHYGHTRRLGHKTGRGRPRTCPDWAHGTERARAGVDGHCGFLAGGVRYRTE